MYTIPTINVLITLIYSNVFKINKDTLQISLVVPWPSEVQINYTLKLLGNADVEEYGPS